MDTQTGETFDDGLNEDDRETDEPADADIAPEVKNDAVDEESTGDDPEGTPDV